MISNFLCSDSVDIWVASPVGWCCLFDQFARESHTMTQDCINSMETEEQVDDYLFHDEQPTNVPKVGDTHLIGTYLLRCIQVGGECATNWDVYDGKHPMGEISMKWDALWRHNQSLKEFNSIQEALADLVEAAQELVA